MDFLKDLWLFIKERNNFWLLPIFFVMLSAAKHLIIILLLIGLIIVFAGSSAIAPFIYTLF